MLLSKSPHKASPKKAARPQRPTSLTVTGAAFVAALPAEIMHQVFMIVLDMDGTTRPMAIMPLVCWRWAVLLQSSVMWEFMCKRHFVCYSMVQRLRTTPVNADEIELVERVASTPILAKRGGSDHRHMSSFLTRILTSKPAIDIDPPTNRTVRTFTREVARYIQRKRYQELVSRRRTFVLHAFLSLALLLFACTLLTAMCAAEGLDPITMCNADVSFSFLWLTYVSILGIVVSNIVMEAHFEPRPLLTRLRNHTRLIMTSTAALAIGALFVALPTYLVQQNVKHRTRSWLQCAAPIITALLMWQVEVLYVLKSDLDSFIHRPQLSLRVMYHSVTYMTPTMFTGSIVALSLYLDGTNNPLLLILGCLPLGLTFFTLSIIFFLDYMVWHRSSDLIAAFSLGVSNVFCILIVWFEWRGLLMAPLVVGAFCFFFGHFHELRKKVDAVVFDPDGDQVLFVEDE